VKIVHHDAMQKFLVSAARTNRLSVPKTFRL